MKHVCQYAILRFVPFPETGEFANIGIVLANAELNFFGFKLTEKGWGRTSRFFEPFDRRLYAAALSGYQITLERIRSMVDDRSTQAPGPLDLFQELTRRRNGLIQFSDPRVRVAPDPEKALQQCFDYYVDRNFLVKTAPESVLEREVRTLLKEKGLAKSFAKRTIGNDEFNISLPFVRFASKQGGDALVTSVIKPLHLAHPKPSDITDHGLIWKSRLVRLRDRNFISSRVLLPVEGPKPDAEGTTAFMQICDDLAREGFDVIAARESNKILTFAQH